MILLCGIPSEPPLARVRDALAGIGAPHVILNQRGFAGQTLDFELTETCLSGRLKIDGYALPLEAVRGVYSRLIDYRDLPEYRGLPAADPGRDVCAALHDALSAWMEIAPARVVNRASAMGSNGSKPYQAQLIRAQGFAIPETLITNDPDLVRDFLARWRRVIYKSISGVRSIVRTLEERDLTRLGLIRGCPTQFQQLVEGIDVRVHTIGGSYFATAIRSGATDYRYASEQGGPPAMLEAIELPSDLADRCIRLSAILGLPFSGIDLRLHPDGTAYCFEVNPCPGFSFFEYHTGQPIAHAVARYLASDS